MLDYKFKEYRKYLEQLNNETEEHSIRVAQLCEKYAKTECVNEDVAYKIGLLHDIGKIFIPSRILKKDTRLTELEREMIDLHSYYGYKMLKEIGEPKSIYLPVLFHHGFGKHQLSKIDESIDENDIKAIRLIHTMDIFDAMASKRAYHSAYVIDDVLKILGKDILCDEKLYCALKKDNEGENNLYMN